MANEKKTFRTLTNNDVVCLLCTDGPKDGKFDIIKEFIKPCDIKPINSTVHAIEGHLLFTDDNRSHSLVHAYVWSKLLDSNIAAYPQLRIFINPTEEDIRTHEIGVIATTAAKYNIHLRSRFNDF